LSLLFVDDEDFERTRWLGGPSSMGGEKERMRSGTREGEEKKKVYKKVRGKSKDQLIRANG